MRPLSFLALVLLASTAHAASPSPPSNEVVATLPPLADAIAPAPAPQVALPGKNSPNAPTAIAVISCEVDDHTGEPGRHGVDADGIYHPELAAKNWRDLELHLDHGELVCKRQLVEIQDKDEVVNGSVQLHHNFGEPAQCAAGAALFFTTSDWDAHHAKWAVVAVGCPTPITDQTGKIVGWHMPECPSHVGKLTGIKCKYDESQT